MKISEIIMDKYKLRISPTVYYDLLADVREVEEEQEPTTKIDCAEQNGCITCSIDDGDDCCRKLFEESMQEPTTKNDLVVDCISRDEVCCYVAEFVNHEFSTRGEEELIDNIITGIEHLPSVTPQERKGHWISTETKGVRYAFWCRYKCTLCGGLSAHTNFCPNCGAKMVEPQESEDNNG